MQVKHRSCFKCKYEIETTDTKCARCGKRLRSRTEMRILGAIMLFLGSLILAIMGTISLWMYNIIVHPETANGAKFNGDVDMLMVIAGVFSFVILFGLVAVITGLWQLILGKRNMILIWIILGMGIIFIIGGQVMVFFTKN